MIDSFTRQYAFLSNFFPSPITFGEIRYDTAEHAFQAQKFSTVQQRLVVRDAPSPSAAKRLGRTANLPLDWEEVKVPIMKQILEVKFAQDSTLGWRLIETSPHVLVEGNHWHDNFWGNCTCVNCTDIKGRNFLGKLLIEIRSRLLLTD